MGGASSEPGSFCALDLSAFNCQVDLDIAFVSAVTNLVFDVSGWNVGDLVNLSIFDAANMLLGTVAITSDVAGLDLTSFGSISRLFFDDSSTGAGVAYGNFSFNQVASVPLPATLPLLAGALVAGAALRRKRKAA